MFSWTENKILNRGKQAASLPGLRILFKYWQALVGRFMCKK